MHVVLLHNPVAGAGRAAAMAERLRHELDAAGVGVLGAETPYRGQKPAWIEQARGARALIVIGGDGTVRSALPLAMEADLPLYQYPLGTENLFAREFGMDRSLPLLKDAIERGEVTLIDLGKVNGQWFSLMASVGFDADVVHELARVRRGGISHLSYLRPLVTQFTRWRPSRVQVTVDGVTLPLARPGILVVANSKQYGVRLDPARRASMSDGRLDVVHLPAGSRWGLILAALRCRLGRHLLDPGVTYTQGTSVEVATDPPARCQLDGDPAMSGLEAGALPILTPMRIDVVPGCLKVLRPPRR